MPRGRDLRGPIHLDVTQHPKVTTTRTRRKEQHVGEEREQDLQEREQDLREREEDLKDQKQSLEERGQSEQGRHREGEGDRGEGGPNPATPGRGGI